MSPPEEITKIKVEIERLEQLCKDCGDSGIRKRIEAWIEAEKKETGARTLKTLVPQD